MLNVLIICVMRTFCYIHDVASVSFLKSFHDSSDNLVQHLRCLDGCLVGVSSEIILFSDCQAPLMIMRTLGGIQNEDFTLCKV